MNRIKYMEVRGLESPTPVSPNNALPDCATPQYSSYCNRKYKYYSLIKKGWKFHPFFSSNLIENYTSSTTSKSASSTSPSFVVFDSFSDELPEDSVSSGEG